MNHKRYGKKWAMRMPARFVDLLDEMKRRDMCENYAHGIRIALREYAKNHELPFSEAVPA